MTSSKLLEVLSRDVTTARAQGFKLALTISQTSGKTNSYLTPIRLCGDVAVTGVITDSTNEATEVAAALTAECQWLFVDVEKKLAPKRNGTEVDSRNFFNSIAEVVGYSQCVPIWPNRLTIDRILKEVTALLLRSRNLCVGIVGLGHLGSNIARELVNMGVRVVGCPKSISVREISLENSINLSKSSGTISDFKL